MLTIGTALSLGCTPSGSEKLPQANDFSTPSADIAPTLTDSGDSGETSPDESDPGWVLGTVRACSEPGPVSYAAAPEVLGSLDGLSGMDEFGSVAWWREGGADHILHTTLGNGVAVRRIGSPEGEARLVSIDHPVRTFQLEDLDRNGHVDLIGLGTGLFVLYDVLTPSPTGVLVVAGRDPWLMLSEGCGTGHWLEVDAPAGATVQVKVGDQTWTHLLTTNPGWAASQPPRAHIGLGDHATVDRVTLTLPHPAGPRTITLLGPVETNQRIAWFPPSSGCVPHPPAQPSSDRGST